MCEVKINNKQVDSVHLLMSMCYFKCISIVELTNDNKLAVMDNMSEGGTIKVEERGGN